MKKIVLFLSFIAVSTIDSRQKQRVMPATEIACQIVADQVLHETNVFRAKKGLPRLLGNKALSDIARRHSMDMAQHNVGFGHDGFDKRVRSFPFKARAAAENVFMANYKADIAPKAVNSWINSSGHLKNLIGPYTYCGVGVYQNNAGYWYVTQLFARF